MARRGAVVCIVGVAYVCVRFVSASCTHPTRPPGCGWSRARGRPRPPVRSSVCVCALPVLMLLRHTAAEEAKLYTAPARTSRTPLAAQASDSSKRKSTKWMCLSSARAAPIVSPLYPLDGGCALSCSRPLVPRRGLCVNRRAVPTAATLISGVTSLFRQQTRHGTASASPSVCAEATRTQGR